MENNEELVLEDNTENVEEQTTEEIVDGNGDTTEEPIEEEKAPVRTYTDEEVDDIVKRKLHRKETKIREEYEKKYGKVEELLKAGLETDSFDDAVDSLQDFYEKKGVKVNAPKYTKREEELLANAEAEDIISAGYDEISEETDRLANLIEKGTATERDKVIFKKIAEERKRQIGIKELASIGVKEEEIKKSDFIDFEKKLNPNMSMKEKYEMYLKFKPKPKVEKIGSMKNDESDKEKVKDFYTFEEASKFTRADLYANPKLEKAIENSMIKW